VAVVAEEGELTYEELRARVACLAAVLLDHGHAKGDRIGILAPNSPWFVVSYLGVMRAGLVAVPLAPELTAEDIDRIVRDAAIGTLLVSEVGRARLNDWAAQRGVVLLTEAAVAGRVAGTSAPMPEIDAGRDLAALMFTSGSTGAPKGVMVSHRNLECNTRDIVEYLGLGPDDRAMVVLPFPYCFGLSQLHTLLWCGGAVVLNNSFRLYPELVLRQMQRVECTGLAGVPSTYQQLLRKSRFCRMAFPSLRWLQQAGGQLPNACIQELTEAFPQVRFYVMYGQTEATARLSYLPPERLRGKLGSVGTGLASTRLEVLKADGTPVARSGVTEPDGLTMPAQVGREIGEIVAMGDNVTLGYWNDPLETAKVFRSGRLYTGDLAWVDQDGFIFIVERERDMVKSGGYRVSAREVEAVVAELPEIVEAAAVGVPHPLLGEAIQLFVVPLAGCELTAADVLRHCGKRLPAFKLPQAVTFLRGMPHNHAGKIVKAKLRAMGTAFSGGEQKPCELSPARPVQETCGVTNRQEQPWTTINPSASS